MSKLFSLNKKVVGGVSALFTFVLTFVLGFFWSTSAQDDDFLSGAHITRVAHADTPSDSRAGHSHGSGSCASDLDCYDPSGGINSAFDPDNAAPGAGGEGSGTDSSCGVDCACASDCACVGDSGCVS